MKESARMPSRPTASFNPSGRSATPASLMHSSVMHSSLTQTEPASVLPASHAASASRARRRPGDTPRSATTCGMPGASCQRRQTRSQPSTRAIAATAGSKTSSRTKARCRTSVNSYSAACWSARRASAPSAFLRAVISWCTRTAYKNRPCLSRTEVEPTAIQRFAPSRRLMHFSTV